MDLIELRRLAIRVAAYHEWMSRVEDAEALELDEPSLESVLQEFQNCPVVSAARTEWIRRCNSSDRLGRTPPTFHSVLSEYRASSMEEAHI